MKIPKLALVLVALGFGATSTACSARNEKAEGADDAGASTNTTAVANECRGNRDCPDAEALDDDTSSDGGSLSDDTTAGDNRGDAGDDTTPEDDDTPAGPAITEVGRPLGEPTTALIGPDGGEVRSPDGALTVTVPPGALPAETAVEVQLISNHAPLGVGPGYRLSPEGVEFAEPVTLTFTYDEGVLAGLPPEFLWFVSQNASGSWSPQRTSAVDTETKTVTVAVTHFSDWAVGRFIDLALTPAQSLVSPGESVVLGITGFLYDPDRDGDDELVPLDDGLVALTEEQQLLDSTERYMTFQVQNWRLNGRDAPGNAAHGELSPLERKALYTAPSTAPDPNTVAVSVDLRATNQDGSSHQYTLMASITVHRAEYYLTLSAPDGQFLFVGRTDDDDGDEPRSTGDAIVYTDLVFGLTTLSVLGTTDGIIGDALIDFATEGTAPGTYPVARALGSGFPGSVSYEPDDNGSSGLVYQDYYYDLYRDPESGACLAHDHGSGGALTSPFSVTIDRLETDEDSGIEVVYGSYGGTLYAAQPAEWFERCATPPGNSAAVSGTFKLPVKRLD